MLAAKAYENICVVGDDAQSIYSFHDANLFKISSILEPVRFQIV
ncbi:MAG: UvrD-helicase domain-containing protein [Crocinitomicaceae bacterium]